MLGAVEWLGAARKRGVCFGGKSKGDRVFGVVCNQVDTHQLILGFIV